MRNGIQSYAKGEKMRAGIVRIKREHPSELYTPTNVGEEASICLNCDLPAHKCKGGSCKRYDEEIKKIRSKGNG